MGGRLWEKQGSPGRKREGDAATLRNLAASGKGRGEATMAKRDRMKMSKRLAEGAQRGHSPQSGAGRAG